MRLVREITADEENFRVAEHETLRGAGVIRRDPVEPEPMGTIVLMAFRVTGYDPDCDGSLMARLEQIHVTRGGERTGLEIDKIGLYPESGIVVTQEELHALWKSSQQKS